MFWFVATAKTSYALAEVHVGFLMLHAFVMHCLSLCLNEIPKLLLGRFLVKQKWHKASFSWLRKYIASFKKRHYQ